MAEEWVDIKYDGIDGVAKVTLSSFNNLYKAKGWRLAKWKAPVAKVEAPVVKESVKKPTKKAESKDE